MKIAIFHGILCVCVLMIWYHANTLNGIIGCVAIHLFVRDKMSLLSAYYINNFRSEYKLQLVNRAQNCLDLDSTVVSINSNFSSSLRVGRLFWLLFFFYRYDNLLPCHNWPGHCFKCFSVSNQIQRFQVFESFFSLCLL